MTHVSIAPYPGDATRIFRPPLLHLLDRNAQASGRRHRLVMHGPLPVHTLHPIRPGGLLRVLSRAPLTGWRALLTADGSAVAIVDVGNADSSHVQVRNDEPAIALQAALAAAAEQFAAWKPRGHFTLRLLEVPALFTTALWFVGHRPLFFPTRLDGRRCDRGCVLNRRGLIAALTSSAVMRLGPPVLPPTRHERPS